LLNDLAKVEREADLLRRRLTLAEERAAAMRQRLALLEQLGRDAITSEPSPRPRLVEPGAEPANGWLRGAAIRQVAVRLLAATARPDMPIHYTEWLSLLSDAGYGIQSADPAAAFLTQIGRSPVVVRADKPGLYALDLEAPERLRRRLEQLNDELLALHEGQQTIEEIATTRERRSELIAQIGRIERALEEALEAVGSVGDS
ncbi:MAG TPA: hypothetical protein VNT58_10625, partial [Gaiellaceae bacterium]|nr:hypothetical protein [Gaiellaceae bacterium]